MKRSMLPWTILTCLTIALAGGVALAADQTDGPATEDQEPANESAKKPESSPLVQAAAKSGKQATQTKVYDNAELAKMFGAAPEATRGPAAESGSATADTAGKSAPAGESDPLTAMFAAEARKKEQAQKIAAGEQRVAAAKERLAQLKKRKLATRNPFLARPKAPDEGVEEWKAMNAEQRAKHADQEFATARTALSAAERELAELRSGRP